MWFFGFIEGFSSLIFQLSFKIENFQINPTGTRAEKKKTNLKCSMTDCCSKCYCFQNTNSLVNNDLFKMLDSSFLSFKVYSVHLLSFKDDPK